MIYYSLSSLLSIAIFIQLIFAPIVFLVTSRNKKSGDAVAVAASSIPFIITILLFNDIYSDVSIYEEYYWIPAFQLKLGFLLDSLSYP
ncbi:MAG: hypothetical protein QXP74_07900, partial [Nitrososphaerota archaeon]